MRTITFANLVPIYDVDASILFMPNIAAVIRASTLLAILTLCIWDGVVMTKFTALYAEQTDNAVTSMSVIKVWIFPFILFAASLLLRKSAPKLIILSIYVLVCVLLNVKGYHSLKDDVPFAGAFDGLLQVFLLFAFTLPLLIIAQLLEVRSRKFKISTKSRPNKGSLQR